MTTQTLERKLRSFAKPLRQGELLRWLYRHFPPRAIATRETNRIYLNVVKTLMVALEMEELSVADTRDAREYLPIVIDLIAEFEKKEFPMEPVAPEEVLRFFMDEHRLTQYDLADELGGQPVVSAILNGKRKLNRAQIERLSARFHISPAVFYTAPKPAAPASR